MLISLSEIMNLPAGVQKRTAAYEPNTFVRLGVTYPILEKEEVKLDIENLGSRKVKIGNTVIGGGEKITVQSMLNRPASDIEGSIKQAVELEKAGCEIVRAAIPDMKAVKLIPAIKEKINIPLVADIHFDYRLALAACEAGIDKIRINPGNIGDMEKVKAVVKACQSRNIPIRIGVNGGSLEKYLLAKYGSPTPEALVVRV